MPWINKVMSPSPGPSVWGRQELTDSQGLLRSGMWPLCQETAEPAPQSWPYPYPIPRYSPHKDADPLKPREPAIIRGFIAYKNQEHGAWLRGGDVWLDGCR